LKHLTALAVLGIFGVLTTFTVKAGQSEPVVVIGLGLNSCGQYLLAIESEKKERPPNEVIPDGAILTRAYGSYVDFADGYLRGSNSVAPTPYQMVGRFSDHSGRMAWLENYCRSKPVSFFVSPVYALRQYLAEQRR
jgi:hypothetical protein